MGKKNEKDDAKAMGLRSHSRHRLRGRGTASAVEGASFALFRCFYVLCIVKLLALGLPLLKLISTNFYNQT